MTSTAEAYGFGARMPYAQPRASEYEMKERVRLSGLFPRVRNEPLSNQLQALMKEFDKNAALTGILERRRRLEERQQFELKGREGMDALNRDLAPPFRAGLANAATSASVAEKLVRSREAAEQEQLQAAQAPAPNAADVMTGNILTPAQQREMIFQEGLKKGYKSFSDKASKDKRKQLIAAQQGTTQVGGSVSSTDPLQGPGTPIVPKAKGRQRAPGTPKAGTPAPTTAKDNRRSRSKSVGRAS